MLIFFRKAKERKRHSFAEQKKIHEASRILITDIQSSVERSEMESTLTSNRKIAGDKKAV